jgi:hypothetical protein
VPDPTPYSNAALRGMAAARVPELLAASSTDVVVLERLARSA